VILLKKPKLQLKDLQETPSVEVEDRSDYLRSGNVKLDDQSLGLPERKSIKLWPDSQMMDCQTQSSFSE
jgi:hypothetical protein